MNTNLVLNKDFFISKDTYYAFQEGYYAFSKGWIACKYNPETLKGKEWQRGFDTAYFDNLNIRHRGQRH